MGARFAQEYPKIASRLDLEPSKCEDPHVERMLEAFAFLSARVHKRIDEDVPEISEALLEIVYPHYVRPIPSMSLVEFELDREQGKLTAGLPVPRDSLLYSRPVNGVPCKFCTCYDTTLWPVRVAALEWMTPDRLKPGMRVTDAVAALRLELHCFTDLEFKALDLSALRLHLAGDTGVTYTLYELLCNNCTSIVVREPGSGKRSLTLPASSLQPIGFGEHDAMLPYPRRSFLGYRLLQEYFAFPEKFLFFDLRELDRAVRARFRTGVEVLLFLDKPLRLEQPISADTFRLGVTPIVNLFEQVAEPIRVTRAETEYRVVPDVGRQQATEVYSIESITSVSPHLSEPIIFEPFYSCKHAAEREQQQAFWHTTRRPSARKGDS